MNVEELLVRELVRDLYARYNRSGDKGRIDEVAACFAEDGVLEVRNGFEAIGREQIRDALGEIARKNGSLAPPDGRSGRSVVRHLVASLLFESVGTDRVESSAYYTVFHVDAPDHWGTYRDVLVKVDGEWLFARRTVDVDGSREASAKASIVVS